METDVPDIEKKEEKEDKKTKYTRKQWLTICAIACSNIAISFCYTIQSPIYPKEAELRGATATEYGFVFSIYELTCFLASPLIGKCIHILGPKRTLNVGMMVTCISLTCFGLLEYVESHIPFIVLSFVFRITEAIGSSTSRISSFAILGAVFPDTFGTSMGSLEAIIGLGILLAPPLGELLYAAGGFKLPFLTIAVLLVILDLIIVLILPPVQKKDETDDRAKIWEILKLQSVPIVILCAFVATVNTTFLLPLLEPHIRNYNLTPILAGLIFTIPGICYAILSPLVGRICDKWVSPKIVICLSMLMTIVGFIVLGPTPHLGIPNNLASCVIGLVLIGFSSALSVVPTMIDINSSAIKAGYPNDASTTGIVTGLWFSVYSLGAFLGPSISGFLYDLVGFDYATLFVIAVCFAMFCALTIYIGIERGSFRCQKQPSTVNN